MKKIGMQAVDLAIQNGVDLDGTPIPPKMLDLYNRIMDEENKRQRSGVKKSMRNRCVKTGSKHFDKETLNQLLIDSGWEGLKEKEILFFYNKKRIIKIYFKIIYLEFFTYIKNHRINLKFSLI